MSADFMDFFDDNSLAVLLHQLRRSLGKEGGREAKLLDALQLRDFVQRMLQAHLTCILFEVLPCGSGTLGRSCCLLVQRCFCVHLRGRWFLWENSREQRIETCSRFWDQLLGDGGAELFVKAMQRSME